MRNFLFLGLLVATLVLNAFGQQSPASTSIDPPNDERLVLELHAEGVQIYSCVLDKTALNWTFHGPEAKLANSDRSNAGTHYAGPTWKLLDGSEVKGTMVGTKPSPDSGSIPWLPLKVARHAGEGKLQKAEYVTRTDTKDGVAPSSGCDASHQGEQSRVPYSAIYRFYGK